MPVAYSKHTIVNSTLRADTPAHCIADIGDQVLQAGWALDRTITGGAVYVATSPDSVLYQAKMLLQDDLSFHTANPSLDIYNFRSVVIRFMNMAESVKSFQHQLRSDGFFGDYQSVIGKCQLFLSQPGHNGTSWSSFAGGIPALPTLAGACVAGLTLPTITDMWWTCGGSQWGFDFRTQAECYACMCYYLNGVLVTAPDNNSISPTLGYLCLFPLTAPNTHSGGTITWPSITYSSHAVLNIDAFLGWAWHIHGQLWDAFLQTAATTLDLVGSYLDQDSTGAIFRVRTLTWHSEFYSSLVLITEVTGAGAGNSAY